MKNNRLIFLISLALLNHTIHAMNAQPSHYQVQEATLQYQTKRDQMVQPFISQWRSEEKKETYFTKLKELYELYKQEACIGCVLCTAFTAIGCCAIPYTCDSQFCYDYPAGWICCCIIKCGAIGVDAAIADKVINDCYNFLKTRKVVNQVAAVKQLRALHEKIEKVE